MVKTTSVDQKNSVRMATIPAWLNDQVERWLQKKPTGSATITIEIHAAQGTINGGNKIFAVKESV